MMRWLSRPGLWIVMVAALGTTFLIVTHDPRIAERCDRTISIIDGRVR